MRLDVLDYQFEPFRGIEDFWSLICHVNLKVFVYVYGLHEGFLLVQIIQGFIYLIGIRARNSLNYNGSI